MKRIYWVYVTAPNRSAALRLAETVVSEKLAACANVFAPIASVYHWKGKIEHSKEAAVILKTSAERWPALKHRVVALHSYETPCVLALPVLDGHVPFLKWVVSETETSVSRVTAKKRTKGP